MTTLDHLPTRDVLRPDAGDRTGALDPADLDDRLCALIVTPSDPAWDEARQAWNLAVDQRPAAVAFPRTADDVMAIVDLARARGLRVAPQGTGHNAGAHASLAGTILVKTARMRDVRIDPKARIARVEAGAVWTDVTVPAGATASPRSPAPRRTWASSATASAAASAGSAGATGSPATASWPSSS